MDWDPQDGVTVHACWIKPLGLGQRAPAALGGQCPSPHGGPGPRVAASEPRPGDPCSTQAADLTCTPGAPRCYIDREQTFPFVQGGALSSKATRLANVPGKAGGDLLAVFPSKPVSR